MFLGQQLRRYAEIDSFGNQQSQVRVVITEGHYRGAPALMHPEPFGECILTALPESLGSLRNLRSA